MLTAEALRHGGVLIVPLLLLSVAVVAVAIDRLRFWWRWRQVGAAQLEALLSEVSDRTAAQAALHQERLCRRLERSLSRWDGCLELAMVLGPLLGLLASVVGLMRLLRDLGPDLVLPAQSAALVVGYGQVLVGTVLGLLIATIALVVQRLCRMQRQAVINTFADACFHRRAALV